MSLKYCKTSENAFVPTKSSKLKGGYDLRSAYNYEIPPRGKMVIKTDLKIQVSDGAYGRITSLFGLHSIGLDTPESRGSVCVEIKNANKAFSIRRGDCIALLIVKKREQPKLEEYNEGKVKPEAVKNDRL